MPYFKCLKKENGNYSLFIDYKNVTESIGCLETHALVAIYDRFPNNPCLVSLGKNYRTVHRKLLLRQQLLQNKKGTPAQLEARKALQGMYYIVPLKDALGGTQKPTSYRLNI